MQQSSEGFDPASYRDEVHRRWGRDSATHSDGWWRAQTREQQQAFMAKQHAIAAAFGAARRAGLTADCDAVQHLARRQYEWLSGIPGTPQSPDGRPTRDYYVGLAQMYVADNRFAANYDRHEPGSAQLVRAAMEVFAARHL